MIPQHHYPSSSETASLVVQLRAAQERLCQALGTALAIIEMAHELHVACRHLTRLVSPAPSAWDASGEHSHTQVVFVLAGARLRWVEVCANEALSSLLAGLFACQSPPLLPLPPRKPNIRARLARLAEACEDAVDGLARVADQVHQDTRESRTKEHHQAAAYEQEEAHD